MITHYNPLENPDPEEWTALEEMERIELVMEYHTQNEEEMPDVFMHCAIQAVIEYQVALGDEYPVKATLNRLIDEGLDLHEAIHAIASVLIKYLYNAGNGDINPANLNSEYFDEVKHLTVQKWYDEFG